MPQPIAAATGRTISGPAIPLTAEQTAGILQLAAAEKASATLRAYKADWLMFTDWCHMRHNVEPLGVALEYLAAIGYAHQLAGMPSPTAHEAVRSVVRGFRRTTTVRPVRKAAATASRLATMLDQIPANTLQGKRDRALLLLGFAGAFRRSELVALDVADLVFEPEGVRVTIRRSKTDQEGRGHEIAIPTGTALRPVAALRDWLNAGEITAGPVFRRMDRHARVGEALTVQSVALVVKKHAAAAGLDPDAFAGHSLPAGFLASAAEAGADVLRMMEVSRHKRVETVMGYVRKASAFKGHAGAGFL